MLSVRATLTMMAVTAFAVAITLAFSPSANAQAMGEYGATVGNAAAAAGTAPSIRPPDLGGGGFRTSSGNRGASGGSQTIEIRGGGSDEAAPRARRTHHKDSDADSAADDWVQVK
jgi:hypothetical protein